MYESADFHRIQGENRGFPSDFTGFPADLRISDFLKSRIPGLTSKHGFEGFPADFQGFPRISLISPDPGFPPGRISDPWLLHRPKDGSLVQFSELAIACKFRKLYSTIEILGVVR